MRSGDSTFRRKREDFSLRIWLFNGRHIQVSSKLNCNFCPIAQFPVYARPISPLCSNLVKYTLTKAIATPPARNFPEPKTIPTVEASQHSLTYPK